MGRRGRQTDGKGCEFYVVYIKLTEDIDLVEARYLKVWWGRVGGQQLKLESASETCIYATR